MSYANDVPGLEDTARWAIRMADQAAERGERPFASVVVDAGGIPLASATGSHTPEDPTAHCEIEAIRSAAARFGSLSDPPLEGYAMYTTHEPCPMCCGAILHSGLSVVAWGSHREDFPELFRRKRHTAEDILADTGSPPVLLPGVAHDEAASLMRQHTEGGTRWLP